MKSISALWIMFIHWLLREMYCKWVRCICLFGGFESVRSDFYPESTSLTWWLLRPTGLCGPSMRTTREKWMTLAITAHVKKKKLHPGLHFNDVDVLGHSFTARKRWEKWPYFSFTVLPTGLLLFFLISIRSNLTQHCQIVTICWTTVLYHSSRLPRKTGVCSISYHCCRIECFAQLVPSLRELNIPFCLLNSGKLHPMTYLSRKCEVFAQVYPLTPCHSTASGHSRRPSRLRNNRPLVVVLYTCKPPGSLHWKMSMHVSNRSI